MNTKQLWKSCLLEIETGMSKANFSTWFKNTSILKEETGIVYVGVPNEFVRDWLKNKYHKLLHSLLYYLTFLGRLDEVRQFLV